MANVQETEDALVAFVCRNYLVETDEFSRGESLVDQGVIDSFGLVEIAAFMEKKFGVKVESAEMNRANFGSITKMATFICGKSAP